VPKELEQILQQKEFLNLGHKAHLALILAGNFIFNKNQALFLKYGITSQQFNVLRILRGQYPKPSCLLLIKERIIDKASDISRLVERLRVSGYLQRCISEEDHRYVEVLISEKGLSVLEAIDKEFTDDFFQLGDLDDDEVRQLIRLIERIL
jgi:DNA-binding MarR family transcriptional regulator